MSTVKKLTMREMLEIKRHLDSGSLKVRVLEISENDDGSANVSLEVNEEFVSWFKEREGLKRWSNKRFQKFFTENLQNLLNSKPQK